MPTTRSLKKGDLVFYSDVETNKSVTAKAGSVAINVSLAGVAFEADFLRVGDTIGFVIEEFDNDVGEIDFRLLKPFKVLAVENVVTDAMGIGEKTAPATICIESDEDLSNLKQLLKAISNESIVALAFGVN